MKKLKNFNYKVHIKFMAIPKSAQHKFNTNIPLVSSVLSLVLTAEHTGLTTITAYCQLPSFSLFSILHGMATRKSSQLIKNTIKQQRVGSGSPATSKQQRRNMFCIFFYPDPKAKSLKLHYTKNSSCTTLILQSEHDSKNCSHVRPIIPLQKNQFFKNSSSVLYKKWSLVNYFFVIKTQCKPFEFTFHQCQKLSNI